MGNLMRIGLIGANGQVGTGFTLYCRRHAPEVEIVPIVRNRVGAVVLESLGISGSRIGSIDHPDTAVSLLGDCDFAINCAHAPGLPRASRRANEDIVGGVANAARVGGRLRGFVQMSSVIVYGMFYDLSTGSTFERPLPETNYGKDKLHIEDASRAAFQGLATRLYVVRLGHVYGPYQENSRGYLSVCASQTMQLPFDGQLASNAIHVDTLAAQLLALFGRLPEATTMNGVEGAQNTWRSVFDWHAEATGYPTLPGLDEATSLTLRRATLANLHRSPAVQLGRDIVAALRAAGKGVFVESQAIRPLATSALLRLPDSTAAVIKHHYTKWNVRRQAELLRPVPGQAGPAFFSHAVPGPTIGDVTRAEPSFDAAARLTDLRLWNQRSRPPFLTAAGR